MSEQITFGGAAQGGNGNGSAPAQRLRDLSDGQSVDCVFAVRERELRQKRNGEDWLRVTLGP